MDLDEQQIEQVKEIVNQILSQRDAEQKLKPTVWAEVVKANFLMIGEKLEEFQQNIEKLQQFYDKFNGEK